MTTITTEIRVTRTLLTVNCLTEGSLLVPAIWATVRMLSLS
jgi:hypothetical protein